MSIPTFSISSALSTNPDTTYVVGLRGNGDQIIATSQPELSAITSLAQAVHASTRAESHTCIPLAEAPSGRAILVGLDGAYSRTDVFRDIAGTVTRVYREEVHLQFVCDFLTVDEVLAVLEGALLGTYRYDEHKTAPQPEPFTSLTHLSICTDLEIDPADTARIAAKVEAVSLVKDLVNTPPSLLTPAIFERKASESIAGLPISMTVWAGPDLTQARLGGIEGVGAGSVNPPRLVKLSYEPSMANKRVALVGKGITFDTGGLTLKSGAGMVGMKYDMTGAATALAVIRALASLKSEVAVTAWLALAENMPSATAIKPNDVLTMRNGKTVEVLNTDAEGRLVLADALSMASEETPDLIVDIATLTGAARGALGTRTVGAMGNSDDISRLVESATDSGEAFWRMPLPRELRALLNSDIADLINGRPGNTTAGMLLAGVFLSEFVGKHVSDGTEQTIPWIHLDIAGTADNAGSAYGFTSPGPTGVTTRALIDFILAGA